MVTAGLLHHHLYPRSPFYLAESSQYALWRRPALSRLHLPPERFTSTPPKPGFSQPILKSVQCLHREELAGNDDEAVEWVNKAAHNPMVEFDPVTVFRRIVAERRISSAMAKIREEEALQATSSPPFIPVSKWHGKSGIVVITALIILAVLAALWIFRSKKGTREDFTDLTLADGKDTLEADVNGRRKIIEDGIKAPDSVLTAMTLGAASVSRPKVNSSSYHDTLQAPKSDVVETQTPEEVMDFYPVVSKVAVEDVKPDLHGKAMFEQKPSSASIVDDFTPLKNESVGIEVTEGPWFGKDVSDAASAELQDLEIGATPPLVVAVSEKPNHSNVQVLDFKSEEAHRDGVEQSLTFNQDDGVMSLDASDSKNAFEDVQEGYTLSPSLDSFSTGGQENGTSLLSNADHIIEAIERVPDDTLDGVSSSANMSSVDQVEEGEGFVYNPPKVPSSDYHTGVEASKEDIREDSKKALDAAVPAISIGFGTVGALFGVAGGLQIVGFAALASIISHDFLWAQSRESLWQELNGITDRQKFLEFLARRNIMNRELENPSL